jgi:predicted SnoaL-like aldol condensation-catalyzing enzyme
MDDLVAIHVEYSLPASNEFAISFDVFRFKEGQIIEHWDNAIAPLGANRSGHTQMDGPITIADLDKTASNRQHVTDYVHNILIAPPNTAKLSDYISAAQFIQHSPDQSDGLAAFAQYLQSFKQGQRVMQYHKLQFVVAQGNFVLAASEGLAGDADAPKPTAFYDLFRLEQGLIVEHWDIVATIPPRADWTNDNGKF